MIHLLLAHIVADHGFTDNTKIRSYRGFHLLEHIAWSIFALLAFTFDTLLKTNLGRAVLLAMIVVHVVGDVVRTRIGQSKYVHVLELGLIFVAFVLNKVVEPLFTFSYISREFAMYLLGMSVVSMAVTYVFRNFYPADVSYNDLDGISERLTFFVFFLAGNYALAFLSLLLGFLFRVWKVRKFSHTWWISPLSGIVITLVWRNLIW